MSCTTSGAGPAGAGLASSGSTSATGSDGEDGSSLASNERLTSSARRCRSRASFSITSVSREHCSSLCTRLGCTKIGPAATVIAVSSAESGRGRISSRSVPGSCGVDRVERSTTVLKRLRGMGSEAARTGLDMGRSTVGSGAGTRGVDALGSGTGTGDWLRETTVDWTAGWVAVGSAPDVFTSVSSVSTGEAARSCVLWKSGSSPTRASSKIACSVRRGNGNQTRLGQGGYKWTARTSRAIMSSILTASSIMKCVGVPSPSSESLSSPKCSSVISERLATTSSRS